MSATVQKILTGAALIGAAFVGLPAFAETELQQICHRVGTESDYVAAFEAEGWAIVPPAEAETRLTAAAAVNEVTSALYLFALTRQAADYDQFVTAARTDAPKVFDNYAASVFRKPDQSLAILLVESFQGTQSVMCLFPGQKLAGVEARRYQLKPIYPSLASNVREFSQIQMLAGTEIRTSWIALLPPRGATAQAVAPEAILVSLTLPPQIRH